ncbi:hypothetical protein [Oceanobacillus sp. Castelsardo]|uniref:hypothetical protein n=1 Tax=Oceanobacillus sp. Castelsardo TaxID=1851204 RepID=UPI0008381D29|nr:hypothetical protein [Oceanobacillus sp. Castelsardo]
MEETIVKLLGLEDEYKQTNDNSEEVFATYIGENNRNHLVFLHNERTEDPIKMLALIPNIKRKYLYHRLNNEIGLSVEISQRPDKSMDYKFL